MDPIDKLLVIVGCQQAINRFYAALDASDMDTVAAAMSEQGVWNRQGRALQGPKEVREALAQRPMGRNTAHLVQNLVVDAESETLANASYMTLVYRFDSSEPVAAPVPLGKPLSISIHHERLERNTQGNWLVLEKRGQQKFAA